MSAKCRWFADFQWKMLGLIPLLSLFFADLCYVFELLFFSCSACMRSNCSDPGKPSKSWFFSYSLVVSFPFVETMCFREFGGNSSVDSL